MELMADSKILLYYAFAPIADPEAIRLWQRELGTMLGLRGRIIISKDGINGTVGGEIDACKIYLRKTREHPAFANIDVKWSTGTGYDEDQPELFHGVDRRAPWKRSADFPRLSVKVRDELVSFGAPDELVVDEHGVVGGGERLTPEQVNELVASRGDEVVFFDGRNAVEAAVGRFQSAIVPEVHTTHDFVSEIDSGSFDHLKDRPVITYCTGGIRCEVLSAVMKRRGFNEVYQIDGGIVRYGERFGNDGLWQGSLTVFDGRESLDFGPGAEVLGRCSVCEAPTNQLANCSDVSCRARFVACDEHVGERCTEHGGRADASPAALAKAASARV